jgi:hypothetical protein
MNDDNYELSARDYLLKSAEGEKFVYRDLHFVEGYDDGPFGDYSTSGMSWIGVHEDELLEQYESGLVELKGLIPGKLCKLYFEADPDYEVRSMDLSDPWGISLLVATPRDPRGPFTVSVYREFVFLGWLTGEGLEELAIHLVETSDYGAKLVHNSVLSEDASGERYLRYLILEDSYMCELKGGPSRITSPVLVSPSQLQWEYGEEVYELKRRVTWDSIDDVIVTIDNPDFLDAVNGRDDMTWFEGDELTFVPDVWEPERKSVFVFWDEIFVGRMQDQSEAERFFKHFTDIEHSIGTCERGYIYLDEKDGKHYVAVSAEIRPFARVDWNLAATEQ